MSIQDIKTSILAKTNEAIEKSFGQKSEDLRLGFPPNIELGDFTIECFHLVKQLKKDPTLIAQKIATEISTDSLIQEVKAVGPYVNFKISSAIIFGDICSKIISQGENFGNSQIGQSQRVMIEYLSPNTNKPLHLGHLRNGALGMAIANLFEATGHKVIKANLINDRGVHICKSMLAWQKWADGETPKDTAMKGDHFVGKWYVRYAQEEEKDSNLKQEIQSMLQQWEAGDPKILKLWKTMNDWVYAGFKKTYDDFGLKFDVLYYESETYKLGKNIIAKGIEKKVFYRDDRGAIVFDLPEEEFGRNKQSKLQKVTVLRTDGTSVYMTQDIGTALLKVDEHNLTHSIYIVGQEQEHHFKCLFKILESLGYSWAKGCYHLSYGIVYLPEGKMKSREGKVVDADDLIAKMTNLAAEEIKKRNIENKLSKTEIQKRAAEIGVGAIKFYLLRVNPRQDIHFDTKESISFDGFTGPYCQYAYARCMSILRNAKETKISTDNIDYAVLGNSEELLLIKKLLQFPDLVANATQQFNPGQLTTHIYETAQALNQFYHQHTVLSAKNQKLIKARLSLVQATAIVLEKGLNLLGIKALEEM